MSNCRGPCWRCFEQYWSQMIPCCLFDRWPATHTFFKFLYVLMLGWPILLTNCFTQNSVRFMLCDTWYLPLPKSDKPLLSSSALSSLNVSSRSRGEFAIPVTWVFHWFVAGSNDLIRRLRMGLPGVLDTGSSGEEVEDVSRMTGIFPTSVREPWCAYGGNTSRSDNCREAMIGHLHLEQLWRCCDWDFSWLLEWHYNTLSMLPLHQGTLHI